MANKNPFIAGSWLRGDNFFGRKKLLHEILHGDRSYLWVAGTRRLGKTSLLKQIEYLTSQPPYDAHYLPLFWDLQGSNDLDGLRESLLESVEDADDRFAAVNIDVDELEQHDVFGILRQLKRAAREHGRILLLLCDECEELINIEHNAPEALPKLRRLFQKAENLQTVLTATTRLSRLETSSTPNTSPFLHGFVPPIYLTSLDDEAALSLIGRGDFNEDTAREIMETTNNHPYLIQLICKRLYEKDDLDRVIEEIMIDDMIGHFFAVDFKNLNEKERDILLHILEHEHLSLGSLRKHFGDESGNLIRLLYELRQLGFIRERDNQYTISNFFFKRWLEREKERLFTESTLMRARSVPSKAEDVRTPPRAPDTGETIAHHELQEKLGTGGMGVVFKARDEKLNRLVAMKILLPELMQDSQFRDRFLTEAQAASAMNHPNICTIYQIGEAEGYHFISMEFVDGVSMGLWRQEANRELGEKLDIALQAARAIAHAHKKRIIHRDIKPDNIMVTGERQVKILDFGLARLPRKNNSGITTAGTTLGTLSYMSPEQASGLELDERSDIFSFGVVLYELFAGELPFTGEYELSVLYAIVNEEPASLLDLDFELPSELQDVVMRALMKDRSQRYDAMDDLAADLEQITRQFPPR